MHALVGLEHEYLVFRGSTQVDFREVLHGRCVPGRRLDPGDPHAYRLHSGLKLTCDGREAEIASPPEAVAAGVADRLAEWAAHGSAVVQRLCPDLRFVGESTHLSVSVPDDVAVEAGGLFVRAFGPALMLLMDDADSPGLLVRPRAGRLEFAAEYVHGDDLRAAAAMAVGATAACVAVARGHRARRDLDVAPAVRVEPAVDRWGWYLDRRATGVDLIAAGRAARLRREHRGRLRGQDALERAWKVAREHAEALLGPEDLAAADDAVFGLRDLPGERRVDRAPAPERDEPLRTPDGDVVATRQRPGCVVRPHVLAWDVSVLDVTDGEAHRYLAVARDQLPATLAALDGGRLDLALEQMLARDDLPVLRSRSAAVRGGAFSSVPAVQLLASPERDVFGVARAHPIDSTLPWPRWERAAERVVAAHDPGGGAGGGQPVDVRLAAGADVADRVETITADELATRHGKQIGAPDPAPIAPGGAWWRQPLTWIGVGVSVVAVGVGIVVFGGGDGGPAAEPPAVVDDAAREDDGLPDDGVPDDGGDGGDEIDGGAVDAPLDDPEFVPGPDVTPSPVEGGISPDRLGLFEFGPDGLIRFAYEGDQIIGRLVAQSNQSLTLNLWGFTGQCWAMGDEPSVRVVDGELVEEHIFLEGDRVFILDAFGSGTWITFDRVPAPDIGGGVFRCVPNTGDPVDVVFGDRQADALGEQDGGPMGFSFARIDE